MKYIFEVLQSQHQHGDGIFSKKASALVSSLVGGGEVLLTPSCTHALEMASMLLNLGPADEVIMPSFTFTSAATAVSKFGATPVFVDIDPTKKSINLNQVVSSISKRTRAISWVNYAGVPPEIHDLQEIAEKHDLALVEDNAHGLGGSYKGSPLGSFGDFATQSFHASKNIHCGEGGALIINNSKYLERAEIIREKGTNRSKFIRGEVQKYQWVDQGSSYLMSDLSAALLYAQLEDFAVVQERRTFLWKKYKETLGNFHLTRGSASFGLMEGGGEVAHMFFLEFDQSTHASNFIDFMKSNNVAVTSHYQPLHKSAAGKVLGKSELEYTVTNRTSENLVRLPLFFELEDEEIHKIAELVLRYVRS